MFKVKNGLCPEIMRDIFQLNSDPNSRTTFVIPKVKGEYMGKLTLRYFGPVVWETMLPESFKDIPSLEKFKIEIKNWIPECKCRLCKIYTAGVGFTEITRWTYDMDTDARQLGNLRLHFTYSIIPSGREPFQTDSHHSRRRLFTQFKMHKMDFWSQVTCSCSLTIFACSLSVVMYFVVFCLPGRVGGKVGIKRY